MQVEREPNTKTIGQVISKRLSDKVRRSCHRMPIGTGAGAGMVPLVIF